MTLTSWTILGIAILITCRGISGLIYFFQGQGAKVHSFYHYLAHQAGDYNIFVKYVIWFNSIFWVGIKPNPTKSERIVLLINSSVQTLAGIYFALAARTL